ncbi:MAG: phage tail protein [Sarcina sp.]
MTLEELQIVIDAQTKNFQREIDKVEKEMRGMTRAIDRECNKIKNCFSRVGKMIAALGIGKIFKDSIISAMDSIESESLFNTVFGNLSNGVRQWSNELQEQLGLNGYAIRKNVAVLFNMTKSMGLTSEEALKLSKDMTLLTEDMASFYNLSSSEAFTKIRTGLTGETEPLKQIGILVDENTVKQYAYANGIAEVGSKLTNSQKVMGRYIAITQQTAVANGDLARTINSPANQMRILQTNLQLLKIELGRAFMPILQIILPILNSFVKSLTVAANAVARFMAVLFGTKSSGGGGSGAKSTAKSINEVSSATTSAGASASKARGITDNYNKSLDKTGKQAKKTAKEFKGFLAGFDEINKFSVPEATDTDSGAGGIGSGAGGIGGGIGDMGSIEMPDFSGATGGLEETTGIIEKAAEKVKNIFLEFFKPFQNAWNTYGKGVMDELKKAFDNTMLTIGNFGKLLGSIWENGGSKFVEHIVGIGLEVARLALKIYNEFILPVVNWFIKFLDPETNFASRMVIKSVNWILENVKDFISYLNGDGFKYVQLFLGLFLGFKAYQFITQMILSAVTVVANTTAMIANTLANGLHVTSIWALIGAKIVEAKENIILIGLYGKDIIMKGLSTVATWAQIAATTAWNVVAGIAAGVTGALAAAFAFLTSPIGLVILAIAGAIAIGIALYKNWDEVKAFISDCWQKIQAKAQEVWGYIQNNILTPFMNFLKNVFSTDWIATIGVLGVPLQIALDTIKASWDAIKGVFDGVITFVKGVFTGNWKQAWQGVVKIFDSVFGGLINVAKAPINAVIGMINNMIGGLNKVKFPDWVPMVGGKGINIPKIPKLAKGGIVDSATLAVVGEAGKEAVMPLENNTGWITDLAGKISRQLTPQAPQGNNSNEKTEIILKIGETEFGRVAVNSINQLQKQAGVTLLKV